MSKDGLGLHKEAKALFNISIPKRVKYFGENWHVAMDYIYFARNLENLGEFEEARNYY